MAIVFSILTTIGVVLTSIEIVSFNQTFYRRQYEKNDTAHIAGLDEAELEGITNELLSYLKDKRDDLDIARASGEDVFGDREIEHMKDVKELFVYGFRLRNMAFIISALLLIILIFTCPRRWIKYILFGFILVWAIIIIISISLAIGVYIDFDSMWDKFHHIFFTNDLWLLDPDTDILIMMMPGNFFMDMIKGITKIFFLITGIILASFIYLYRKYIKNTTIPIDPV